MTRLARRFLQWGLPVLLAACLLGIAGPGVAAEKADTQSVEVIGTASASDVAQARELAISNSLNTAVETATLQILPLESVIQNFKTLNSVIFNQNSSFIRNYKVLTEGRADHVYRVMVRAAVAIDAIRAQLAGAGILVGRRPMPRILLFMVEQALNAPPPQNWTGAEMLRKMTIAEAAMARQMKSEGLLIIDRSRLGGAFGDVSLSCAPDFSDDEAIALGARLEADIVVVGRSAAAPDPAAGAGDLSTLLATVKARALRVDSHSAVAAVDETELIENGPDKASLSREGLSKAGDRAGKQLAAQIISDWKKDIKEMMKLQLFVKGTQNLANFVIFRRTLKGLPGVKGLQTAEMTPDETILICDYQGKPEDLATALISQPFEAMNVNIGEIGPDFLKLELSASTGTE